MRRLHRIIVRTYSLLITLALLMALCERPMYAHAVTGMTATGEVSTDTLNVRSEPNTSSATLGKLSRGDIVDITGSDDGWYRIEYGEETGYVAGDYIKLLETADVEPEETAGDTEATSEEVFDDEVNPIPVEPDYTTLLIMGGMIILLVIIIFATVKSIRRLSDDDGYDEYDEYDEYDDYYEGEEYDEEEEEEYDYEEPVRRREVRGDRVRKASPVARPVRDGADPVRYMSNDPNDYRIDIDPSYFEKTGTLPDLDEEYLDDEDAPEPIGRVRPEASDKQAEIEAALKKMEELKAEIERIKNE